MKKIFLTIILLIWGGLYIKAQDQLVEGELSFKVVNNNGSTVTIKSELVSPDCWDSDNSRPHIHYLTQLYTGGTQITSLTNTWKEFAICFDQNTYPDSLTFGLGYYKFSVRVNNVLKDYFYIDYRTSVLPEDFIKLGQSSDIQIDFDVAAGKLYYLYTQNEFSTYTTIWDEKAHITNSKSELELYLTVSNQNNNPYLEWNEYYDPNILGYNIYRKISLGAGGSQTNVIFTTSTSFLDENFEIGSPKTPGYDQVEYWIEAKISSSQESLEGNHVQVVGTSIIQWKNSAEKSDRDLRYSLNQNYPNPFNPITTIEFTLEKNSIVSLRVFDILGREITSIINEMLEAGIHQVEFNGGNLKSGIYFYEMQVGNFRDVKKFILRK